MKNLILPIILLASFTSVDVNANKNIPIEHFWCDSAMTGGSLSPNGKYFATMVPASGQNVQFQLTMMVRIINHQESC